MAIIEVDNRGIDWEIFAFITAIQDNSPIFRTMGFEFIYMGEGEAGLRMCPGPDYSSYAGRVNGGVMAALADNVMGMAALTLGYGVVTVDMNLNYLAPILENKVLTAHGYVLKPGKTLIVAEAQLFNHEQQLVAKSRGTFYRTDKIPFY